MLSFAGVFFVVASYLMAGCENFPTLTSDAEAKYLTSQRGKKQLLDPFNYVYCRDVEVKGKTYWSCIRKKSLVLPHCRARAMTIGDIIKDTSAHNHGADPVQVSVKKAEQKVVALAQANPNLQTSHLVNVYCKETCDPAQRSKSATLKVVERKIQRKKAEAQNRPPQPKSYDDLETIPAPFWETFDGERFLLANLDLTSTLQTLASNLGRILIFASSYGLDLLAKAATWSADGTFSVTPEPFYQMYTVLAEVEGKSYPSLFAFLPGKKQYVYKALFSELKDKLDASGRSLNLKRFMIDFEAPAVKEFRLVFGKQIQISGCLVHFRRNLRKHLSQIPHLQSWSCKNADFYTFLSCLVGLCYVPQGEVVAYYTDLVKIELPRMMQDVEKDQGLDEIFKTELNESIDKFLTYFERNYVGHSTRTGWAYPRFPIEIWNMHDAAMDLGQKTTNRNESFHSSFRKAVPLNATLWGVLDVLRDQEAKVRVLHDERRQSGHHDLDDPNRPGTDREKRRSNHAIALKSIVEHRLDFPSKIEYLKRVSGLEAFH